MNADQARAMAAMYTPRKRTWGVRYKLWQMERKITRKARKGQNEFDTDTLLWFWYANPDTVFNELRDNGYRVRYANSRLGYIYTISW